MKSGKPGIGFLTQISSMMLAQPLISSEYYVKNVAMQIIANRPKNVAIYGTGEIGTLLYREIKSYGANVYCFIENKNNLGTGSSSYMGVPLYSLKKAISNGITDIAIGSWEHKSIIIDRIHEEIDDSTVRLRLYSA